MKIHELKIKQGYFEAIESGEKTFEIRKDDRDYEVGDLIAFKPIPDYVPEGKKLLSFLRGYWTITYILRDCPEYGLMPGYCILALRGPHPKEGEAE